MRRFGTCWKAVAVSLVLAPVLGRAAKPIAAPLDAYHDPRFDITMVRCVAQPTAACTINVTAKVNSAWNASAENMLIDRNGVPMHAVSLNVGGTEVSVPSRESPKLYAGVPTKIDIKFGAEVDPNDYRALVIYVGHWTAKTITLRPDWGG